MELKEKFKKGIETHTYQRIDSDFRVNIFLGYNDDGNMSMVLTEPGKVERVKSSKMIDVNMRRREDGKLQEVRLIKEFLTDGALSGH